MMNDILIKITMFDLIIEYMIDEWIINIIISYCIIIWFFLIKYVNSLSIIVFDLYLFIFLYNS